MCEPSQLTMFYKTNRNWGLLSPSAGKLNYREYIVATHYNVTGNGKRERTPKGCQQWQEKSETHLHNANVVSHMAKA